MRCNFNFRQPRSEKYNAILDARRRPQFDDGARGLDFDSCMSILMYGGMVRHCRR